MSDQTREDFKMIDRALTWIESAYEKDYDLMMETLPNNCSRKAIREAIDRIKEKLFSQDRVIDEYLDVLEAHNLL